ncbi:hypothetical protein [Saccharicrinis sp. FJH54]|uniref:hypothetical protein n=1 Tax=Saccharicrinis sp. FJH54 TaxID=3344665 RepID=UPI0035D4BB48
MKSFLLFTLISATLLLSLSSLVVDKEKVDEVAVVSADDLVSNNLVPKATYVQGELEVITLESIETHTVRVSAFPNPIKQNITLLTFGKSSEDLKFLLKAQNKTLLEQQIKNPKESIEIKEFECDVCYLFVYKSKDQIKKYKIIKH